MPFLTRHGFSMHYHVYEGLLPGDTLFVHGNLGSNRWWKPSLSLWQQLAKEKGPGNGDIILAEWRGCGQSQPISSPDKLNVDQLADDYLDLLHHLGKKKVHAVAHSTGSVIVFTAMAKEPALFDKVLLLDPVFPREIELSPELLDAFTKMKVDKDFCAAVLSTTIHQCDPKDSLFLQLVDDAFRVDHLIWEGVPKMLASTNKLEEVKKLSHPVLVLHGSEDPILKAEESKELAELLPNGRYQELTGCGHSYNVENPSGFVEVVDQFLR